MREQTAAVHKAAAELGAYRSACMATVRLAFSPEQKASAAAVQLRPERQGVCTLLAVAPGREAALPSAGGRRE